MADWQELVDLAAGIQSDTTSIKEAAGSQAQTLSKIDATLSRIYQQAGGVSQSRARDYSRDYRYSSSEEHFREEYRNRYGRRNSRKGFLDSFEEALVDGFFGEGFEDELKEIANDFAAEFGVSLSDLPGALGKQLGTVAMDAFKGSEIGKAFSEQVSKLKDSALSSLRGRGSSFASWAQDPATAARGSAAINDFINQFKGAGSGIQGAANVARTILTNGANAASSMFSSITGAFGSAFGGASSAASAGLAEVTASATAAGAAFPPLGAAALGVVIAFKAVNGALSAFGTTIKAVKVMFDALKVAGNRDVATRQQNVKYARKRLEDDYNTLITQPFEILKEAAQSVYDAWNANLRTINATQGYTKADLQDLMASYSSRLQSEGLGAYINTATITENLSKVLQSGMSGPIAEEFAYLATKLNALIPTQDFFNYATTYASVAANAVKEGKSYNDAISYANKSLNDFASGLLYANRELTGGLTTGLTNAASLYEQSAKIAVAARTDNLSQINSVLLAVQGYVGAVAPDLASSLTDTIYKALTGGNSPDIVALRSLAGINASNTEFLQAVAKNPQKVFGTLFSNLAKMYSDSSAAYMEKAEGYASLFGMTSEAFQRIDFNGLASAISNMNMSNDSLNENMALLLSGQTTLNADQLKNKQINEYIAQEGLSYLIDNQAAQFIQQHMWEEQMNRELIEATYAVEITGAAAESLELIKQSVKNILSFLNPVAWFRKAGNVVATVQENKALSADVKKVLELGKVGTGNAKDLYNLTTRNANLNLTSDLVTLMGGKSSYASWKGNYNLWRMLSDPTTALWDGVENLTKYFNSVARNGGIASAAKSSGVSSKYSWGSISKSGAQAARAILGSGAKVTSLTSPTSDTFISVTTSSGTSAASASAANVAASIGKMLEDTYIQSFIDDHKSYEDWAESAKKFNITDFNKAIEDAGYSEVQLREYFEAKETESGLAKTVSDKQHEWDFQEAGITFWETTFPSDYRDPMFELLETNNSNLREIIDNQVAWSDTFRSEWLDAGWSMFVAEGSNNGLFNKFYSDFMKYIVDNWSYNNTAGYSYSDVEEIRKKSDAQERGDTVYALAEMLTKNILDLKDPTMQTNALLAQILIVVNAIMNQNNEVAGTTGQSQLLESLSAMALGMTATSTLV